MLKNINFHMKPEIQYLGEFFFTQFDCQSTWSKTSRQESFGHFDLKHGKQGNLTSNPDKVPTWLAFPYSHDQNSDFYKFSGIRWNFGTQNDNFKNR